MDNKKEKKKKLFNVTYWKAVYTALMGRVEGRGRGQAEVENTGER
jgi:hypothetical protein